MKNVKKMIVEIVKLYSASNELDVAQITYLLHTKHIEVEPSVVVQWSQELEAEGKVQVIRDEFFPEDAFFTTIKAI